MLPFALPGAARLAISMLSLFAADSCHSWGWSRYLLTNKQRMSDWPVCKRRMSDWPVIERKMGDWRCLQVVQARFRGTLYCWTALCDTEESAKQMPPRTS